GERVEPLAPFGLAEAPPGRIGVAGLVGVAVDVLAGGLAGGERPGGGGEEQGASGGVHAAVYAAAGPPVARPGRRVQGHSSPKPRSGGATGTRRRPRGSGGPPRGRRCNRRKRG